MTQSITTGRGHLVLLVPLAAWLVLLFATALISGNPDYARQHGWPGAMSLLLSGAALLVLGYRWNGFAISLWEQDADRKAPHAVAGFPIELWGFGLIGAGLVFTFIG